MNTKLVIIIISIVIIVAVTVILILWYGVNRYQTLSIDYYEDEIIQSTLESHKKRKILVFQCGAYPNPPEFLHLSQVINKAYCDKWGYEYRYLDHNVEDMPPYWLKVNDTHSMIQEDNYDYILHLDADAIFYNDSVSIDGVIDFIDPEEKYLMFVGKDCAPFIPANAGVFLVKRDKEGKALDLISEWLYTCYKQSKDPEFDVNCENWKLNLDKWKCKDCVYAASSYEQGQLSKLFKKYPEKIGILRRPFFSNSSPSKNSFVLHMMAKSDEDRRKVFQEYLNGKRY